MRINAKQTHRALFLALQSGAKKYPGGIRALAEVLSLNGSTLANGLNPDHDCPPPTFATIIEIISLAQCREAVYYINQLIGCVPVDSESSGNEATHQSISTGFLTLTAKASEVIGKGSQALKDGRVDAQERKEMRASTQKMISEGIGFLQLLED